MTWAHLNGTPRHRRADRHRLFIVNFLDGSRAFMRISPELARFGASPPVFRHAQERQAAGELPLGQIAGLIRVR